MHWQPVMPDPCGEEALMGQAVQDWLPAEEKLLAEHWVHTLALLAEKDPAEHEVQLALEMAPTAAENLPAPHGTQLPGPVPCMVGL